jgi:predicted amidohydrolase YtcJ
MKAAGAPMLVVAALLAASGQTSALTADIVFKNGNIHTVNPEQPRATAVAVKAGRIVFVGSDAAAETYVGTGTRVVDLRGSTVVPGLIDSHHHLALVGARELELDLAGTTSLEDFLARVEARVDAAEPGTWITGGGWLEGAWDPPKFPTRFDLDPISPDNPVYLRRGDGHSGVANSAALRIAGIDEGTPSPPGGAIQKDPRTGAPTGMLLEKAQALVVGRIPKPTEAELEQQLVLGARRAVERCWCQIHNPGGGWAMIDRLEKLYAEGRIKLRVHQAVSGPGPAADRLIEQGPMPRRFDDRLALRTIKLFMDGSLGSRTAALLAPYADADGSGLLLLGNQERLHALLVGALRRGIQIETHAIGDLANRTVLDLYQRAFEDVPPEQRKVPDPRWRIEHAQILDPADLPRFARLGVIPSMQPSHAIGDLHWAGRRLGLARLDRAYRWRSLIESGAVVAGGSDAPVERGEPMVEFYAAVARKDLAGFSGEGWHLEEAVTREQALRMFTLWAVEAAFAEDRQGSIAPGKLADLSVLSADIMRIPAAEIPKTRCLMTVIDGEIVFQAAP